MEWRPANTFLPIYPFLLFLFIRHTRINTTKMAQVNIQTTISPYTQEPVCTRPLLSQGQLDVVIADAVKAQKAWKKVGLDERIVIAEKWMVCIS